MLEIKILYTGEQRKPINYTIFPPKNIKQPGILNINTPQPHCSFCNRPGDNADHCYNWIASLDNPTNKVINLLVMMNTHLHQNIQEEDN